MIEVLLQWLHEYGYPTVFVVAVLENFFPLGFLTPGEVVILTAAAISGAATLDPLVVAALAAVGETVGQIGSYALGRYAAGRAVAPLCRRFPRVSEQVERAQAYFQRRGALALIVGRPVWGIKSVLPVVAGMSGMQWPKAVAFMVASSLYYYPALVAIAYYFGLGVGEVAGVARGVGVVFGAILLLLALVALARARRAARRGAS